MHLNHSPHHRHQRRRNARVRRIRLIHLAVHFELMDLRLERRLHLPCGPTELDRILPRHHFADRKTLTRQPRRHGLDIRRRYPKLSPVLLRRKPLMKLRRGLILLLRDQRNQSRFLILTMRQRQHHPPHRRPIVHRTPIVRPARQRMRIPAQRHAIRLIQLAKYPWHRSTNGHRRSLPQCQNRTDRHKAKRKSGEIKVRPK